MAKSLVSCFFLTHGVVNLPVRNVLTLTTCTCTLTLLLLLLLLKTNLTCRKFYKLQGHTSGTHQSSLTTRFPTKNK